MAFNFGNNLIEITAIATLVGSTTAESLTLGSRGAAGVPWAAMSSFGSFYVVKACLAASIPGWLRETLSVNSPLCRSLLGVSSALDNKAMRKVAPANVAGVSISLSNSRRKRNKHVDHSVNRVYVFDEYTAGIVRSCPSFEQGNALRVFSYARDGPKGDTARDWLALAGAAPKLLETVILWRYADWKLSLASTTSWAFFFWSALALQILGVSREWRNLSSDSRLNDILAGDLPTIHGPGKQVKIILDVPVNVRSHFAWRLMWVFGCLFCLSSTIATYILLARADTGQFYLWAGFQCIWLVSRLIFYHFAVKTDGRPYPVVEQKVTDQRYRLMCLAGGVSQHLAQLHPRTSESYLRDLHDPVAIQSYIYAAKSRFDWTAEAGFAAPFENIHLASLDPGDLVDIEVLAVVGDTMLQSTAWIDGNDMNGLDLYDSCLVVFKIKQQTFLVPAARVLSGNVTEVKRPTVEAEAGVPPTFIPKLGPCRAEQNGWVFWIPIGPDKWLYVIGDLDFLGEQRAEVLESAEITRRLELGNLWVSLRHVDEIKGSVQRSAVIGRILLDYFLLDKQNTEG